MWDYKLKRKVQTTHVHKFSEFFTRTRLTTPYVPAQVGGWLGRLQASLPAFPNSLVTSPI